MRAGAEHRPAVSDRIGSAAVRAAKRAQSIDMKRIDRKPSKPGGNAGVLLEMVCPYCLKNHQQQATGRTIPQARTCAIEALFPIKCRCGAHYKHVSGNKARQSNQSPPKGESNSKKESQQGSVG